MFEYIIYKQGGLFHIAEYDEWATTCSLYTLPSDVLDSARRVQLGAALHNHARPNASQWVQRTLRSLWQDAVEWTMDD